MSVGREWRAERAERTGGKDKALQPNVGTSDCARSELKNSAKGGSDVPSRGTVRRSEPYQSTCLAWVYRRQIPKAKGCRFQCLPFSPPRRNLAGRVILHIVRVFWPRPNQGREDQVIAGGWREFQVGERLRYITYFAGMTPTNARPSRGNAPLRPLSSFETRASRRRIGGANSSAAAGAIRFSARRCGGDAARGSWFHYKAVVRDRVCVASHWLDAEPSAGHFSITFSLEGAAASRLNSLPGVSTRANRSTSHVQEITHF